MASQQHSGPRTAGAGAPTASGRRERAPGPGLGVCREKGGGGKSRLQHVSCWGDHWRAAADTRAPAFPAKGQAPASRPTGGRRGGFLATQPDSGARLPLAGHPTCGQVGKLFPAGGGEGLPELSPILRPRGLQQGVASVETSSEQGRRASGSPLPLSLPQKFLVEEEDEKVDVDLGLVEEFHYRYTFVLELQEVLGRGQGQAGVRRRVAPGQSPERSHPGASRTHPVALATETPLHRGGRQNQERTAT